MTIPKTALVGLVALMAIILIIVAGGRSGAPSGRSKIAVNIMAFMLGMATMFSLLGASASALGRLIIQSQDLLLLFGGAIVMVFGVMSLLGRGFTGIGNNMSYSIGETQCLQKTSS